MAADMGPEVEHAHHRHTGHRWLDVVLGVSAVVISLISLFLAIQHGRVMEKMVEASTWPAVMVGYSAANADGSPHITIWATNKGVGPARLDSLEVFHEGVAQSDPQGLLKSILKPSDPNRHFPVVQSDVLDNVFAPKDWLNFVDLPANRYDPEEYSRIRQAVSRLEFRFCYCSVFEECWALDTRKSPRPVSVKACRVPPKMFLH